MADMKDADRTLAALAARQRQVFTRAQAIAAGLTSNDIYYRVSTGVFVRCGHHTLHFEGCTLDYRGCCSPDCSTSARRRSFPANPQRLSMGSTDTLKVRCNSSCPVNPRNRTTIGVVTSLPAIGRLDRVMVD